MRSDPESYEASLAYSRERMRLKRANGYREVENARDRERWWRKRCPGPGLTLDELAERTGRPKELLAEVLRDELRRSRRRVWRDSEGRYRLVVDRFEDGIVEALGRL
jgi:hypothetical protein